MNTCTCGWFVDACYDFWCLLRQNELPNLAHIFNVILHSLICKIMNTRFRVGQSPVQFWIRIRRVVPWFHILQLKTRIFQTCKYSQIALDNKTNFVGIELKAFHLLPSPVVRSKSKWYDATESRQEQINNDHLTLLKHHPYVYSTLFMNRLFVPCRWNLCPTRRIR